MISGIPGMAARKSVQGAISVMYMKKMRCTAKMRP